MPQSWWKRTTATFARKLRESTHEQAVLRREHERIKNDIALRTPGNPALYGYKVYSQFDEDGIIAHIFSRIGEGDRVFVEIGCSDGLENNTHKLLLHGWRGVWIDADADKLRFIAENVPASPRLVIRQAFVSAGNAGPLVAAALATLGARTLDLLSVDIDGDDLNVLSDLLRTVQPRVICTEYNAKFPPPMKLSIIAEPGRLWSGDDYHGASLTSFVDALHPLGYRLIACGVSGVNAFFVRDDDAAQFPDYTAEQLFQPARFDLRRMTSGHPPSLKFLADHMSGNPADFR